jgi:hypothetical protein
VAKRIWLWALDWILPALIPCIENVEADDTSHVFKDELEWTLSNSHFQNIVAHFRPPDVDLFASHLNYKVLPFCLFKPDTLAYVIDAFTLN